MLGRTDEPDAVQVLLGLRGSSRTRAVQEEAVRQLGALAERRGCPVDELADPARRRRDDPRAGDGSSRTAAGSR